MKKLLYLSGCMCAVFLIATASPSTGQQRDLGRERVPSEEGSQGELRRPSPGVERPGDGARRRGPESGALGRGPEDGPRSPGGNRTDGPEGVRGTRRTGPPRPDNNPSPGQFLFSTETFGGNGRTCQTCHGTRTGTVSPRDAQRRFRDNPADPLFLHDGSDDGFGNGVSRILRDATILVPAPLHPNVRLGNGSGLRSVVLRRGIPTTLNTPALDPVLMVDGREPTLESQAASAIEGHALGTVPNAQTLLLLTDFELTAFSSRELRDFANGGPAPELPQGRTASESRGRRFFDNVSPDARTGKDGLCASCHSGPMLNETNAFFFRGPFLRFQSVRVSEFNAAENPVVDFIFANPDGTETLIQSPDPGRALITGNVDDANAFKIPSLHGIRNTAPYFHDNSAGGLRDVLRHYRDFFEELNGTILTRQDQDDIIAFLRRL
jgi:hypothetical protein